MLYRVATYWIGKDPTRMRRYHVSCYTVHYDPSWEGYVQFEIEAKNGFDARKIAAAMRVDMEQAINAGFTVSFKAPNRVVEAKTKAICPVAVPGPWKSIRDHAKEPEGIGLVYPTLAWDIGLRQADVKFLAHARVELPKLIERVERLEKELKRCWRKV